MSQIKGILSPGYSPRDLGENKSVFEKPYDSQKSPYDP